MPITEDDYKVDLELLDRYQGFSTELLRIFLLGVSLLGFFFQHVASGSHFSPESKERILLLLAAAATAFLVSSVFALGHRYFSTDGVFHHIRAARRRHSDAESAKVDELMRNRRYRSSTRYLAAAAVFCGLGTTVLTFGLWQSYDAYEGRPATSSRPGSSTGDAEEGRG